MTGHRARSLATLLTMLATVVACMLATAGTSAAATTTTDPQHGVMNTTCNASRVKTNMQSGITTAVISARWDLFNTAQGTFDANYRALLQSTIKTCTATGMSLVLDAGLAYVPSWVKALPNALLKDQYGDVSTTGQIDMVFNATVRASITTYLKQLVAALPPYSVSAIRVGTATSGELGLPGGYDAGKGHNDSWWAFTPAAQGGTGLASGQTRNPMPGWIPGTAKWNGRAVTTTDALTWWRWYDRAVAQTEYFLATTVTAAGYTGPIHLPVAGRGVLPANLTTVVNRLLAGSSLDDYLHRGIDLVDQIPQIAAVLPKVVIDLTSVDDATAVTARGLATRQDLCALSDASTSTDPSTPVAQWSNLRFARAQVARAGLAAVGENTGPPGPMTGGTVGTDSEVNQVKYAPIYARSCGLATLYFAFEDDLYTGRSGVTMADYVAAWK